jgi:lysophospholipase L1-like esterase
MRLNWAVELAGLTIARRAKAAALRARCYRGEFAFGSGPGEPLVFSVFGDSVGCGFGVSSFEHTFAARVALRLAKERTVVCRVAAVNGARAGDLGDQAVIGDERLVAISIGTNDALHGVPRAKLERDLASFLARLPHAERVVVLGPGDLASMALLPHALRPYVRRHLLAYEDFLRRATAGFANAVHVGFSSVEPLTADHFAEDGFHPGDRGHRMIAALMLQALGRRANSPRG